MNINMRIIAKIGLLLVVIGFFMPIACDRNGFQIAEHLMKHDQTFEGILAYLLFASAVAGVVIGVLLIMNNSVNLSMDLAAIAVCAASAIILYLRLFKDNVNLQNGAYVILTGLIAAVVFQVISFVKKE